MTSGPSATLEFMTIRQVTPSVIAKPFVSYGSAASKIVVNRVLSAFNDFPVELVPFATPISVANRRRKKAAAAKLVATSKVLATPFVVVTQRTKKTPLVGH